MTQTPLQLRFATGLTHFYPTNPLLSLQSSFDHGGNPNQTHKQDKLMENVSCMSGQENIESARSSNMHTDHQNHEERREVECNNEMLEQVGDMEGTLQCNEREL